MTVEVYVTQTASFLPFDPITNDEMELVLGQVGGKPSRARRVILRSNQIKTRHYAIDRATGRPAFSNAYMTAKVVEALKPQPPVEMLATGTSTPDQVMPNHAVMVHGELGWPRLQAVSPAGICLSGTAAFKYAWLAVKAGDVACAVATGSELVSPLLMAEHYDSEVECKLQALEERPEIAFEKDFLRWMLSDGAGAVLLENQPRGPLSLRVDWIELSSAAHQLPACMYSGADKEAGSHALKGWRSYQPAEWAQKSIFAIKQDVRLLNENVLRATLSEPLALCMVKKGLNLEGVDWFLPHMSSHFFEPQIVEHLAAIGLPIPREKWFTNLTTRGNTGAASPYIMLDELFHSGRLQKGERILMWVPESGRFSSGFVYLEVV